MTADKGCYDCRWMMYGKIERNKGGHGGTSQEIWCGTDRDDFYSTEGRNCPTIVIVEEVVFHCSKLNGVFLPVISNNRFAPLIPDRFDRVDHTKIFTEEFREWMRDNNNQTSYRAVLSDHGHGVGDEYEIALIFNRYQDYIYFKLWWM